MWVSLICGCDFVWMLFNVRTPCKCPIGLTVEHKLNYTPPPAPTTNDSLYFNELEKKEKEIKHMWTWTETCKGNKTLTFLCPAVAADLSVNSPTVEWWSNHHQTVEKKDLLSSAKDVRTIAQSMWHNVTDAEWLCCFWRSIVRTKNSMTSCMMD